MQNDPVHTTKKSSKGVSWQFLVVAGVLLFIVAFIAGTRSEPLTDRFFGRSDTPSSIDLSELQPLYDELRSNYDGSLDVDDLIEGAKKGMVDAAGNEYTVYLSPEDAAAFDNDLNGTFEGIGAELGKRDGFVTIVSPLEGSPAEEAGVRSGDKIIEVNGDDASNWSIEEAVSEIRGEKGTSVKLILLRGDSPVEVSITRDTISAPSVSSEIKDGNIGYLRISRFADDTSALAREAAEEFKAAGVEGVVVDVRGNGGGLLESARQIASIWLDDKVVVIEKSERQANQTLRSDSDPILNGVPTVVLIDGGSASASEILAGALLDNDAATLVGTKTFGKGSVQALINVPDGGQLKVTIARWFTPNGTSIDGEGITPETVVEYTDEDFEAGNDVQLDRALEELR